LNGDPINIIADEYFLVQILVNIIDNAIEYTTMRKIGISSFINGNGKATVKISDTELEFQKNTLQIFSFHFFKNNGVIHVRIKAMD